MDGWAYDLHQHILNAGGGHENFLKYRKQDAGKNRSMNELLGQPPTEKDSRCGNDYWSGGKLLRCREQAYGIPVGVQ